MKGKKCENCGGNAFKMQLGVYVCEYCGTEYVADANEGNAVRYLGNFEIEGDVLLHYFGHDDDIVIPDGITRVVEKCFRYISAKSIKCPPSLKRFDGTLEKCEKLEYFEAPGLEEFSAELFSKNKTIKKVVLDSVRKIPNNAFYMCNSLRYVIIPNAQTIGSYAFHNCAVTIVEAPLVQEVKRSGFSCCEKLEEINLPSLEIIGEDAFKGCKQLKRLILPNAKTMAESAFAWCENLDYIEAPNLEVLAPRALNGCKSLKKVAFPNLQIIDEYAFAGCTELGEVICEKAKLKANNNGCFNQFICCPKIETIKTSETINKKHILKDDNGKQTAGCYIATCVYGNYDCPQVWTLRRYRDTTLASTWYGRAFIHTYYVISPTIVKWFGNTKWLKKVWKGKLDKMVEKLQANGFESTPYEDKNW